MIEKLWQVHGPGRDRVPLHRFRASRKEAAAKAEAHDRRFSPCGKSKRAGR